MANTAPEQGEVVQGINAHSRPVGGLAFSRRQLVSAGESAVMQWNIQ